MELRDVSENEAVSEEVDAYFPYLNYRRYQRQLANAIYHSLSTRRHVVAEAAAGFGKTAAVLAACLPIAKRRNLRILYACRTHEQVIGILTEVKRLRESTRVEVKATGLYGRRQLCPLDALTHVSHATFSHACSSLKNALRCPYYTPMGLDHAADIDIEEVLTETATPSQVRALFTQAGRCPYEGLTTLLPQADVVVLTYNYLVNPFMRSLLLRRMKAAPWQVILIVDEAHNLHRVATRGATSSLSLRTVKRSAEEADRAGFKDMANELRKLHSCLSTLDFRDEDEIIVEKRRLSEVNGAQAYYAGFMVQEQKMLGGEPPISYLLALADFLANLSGESVLLLTREGDRRTLEAVDVDPLKTTKPFFSSVYASVSMSGTLRPLEAYSHVIGLPEDTVGLTIPYPFPPENLNVLITKGISTRYKDRAEKLYAATYEALKKICSHTQKGGVAAFFASHELLQGFDLYTALCNLDFQEEKVFRERRWMSSDRVHRICREFTDAATKGKALLLAVQGGRLSEGVDFIAGSISAIAIVGVPYAKPTEKMRLRIEYYDKVLEGKGRLYAYVVPALWSALQAAGRGIRSPEDVCTVVFLDQRFASMKHLIPKWMLASLKHVEVDQLEQAL